MIDVSDKMRSFDLDLLKLRKKDLLLLKEVKALEIFSSGTNNFHPEGLFSTEIFGRVGSKERLRTPAYIDLNIEILHPLVYQHLVSLNKLYKDIMSGKKYAVWNDKIKDFEESDSDKGDTGFKFFVSKIKDIKFARSGSDERDAKIDLIIKKDIDDMLIRHFLIWPAGLRDYTVSDGKPSEDEINSSYRSLLITSKTLSKLNTNNSSKELDPIRRRLQETSNSIYNHFIALIDGKKKFTQNKFSKRSVTNGTRNVIVALPNERENLDENPEMGFNDVLIGILQFCKGITPITVNRIRTKFTENIFSNLDTKAKLFDKKFNTVYVDVPTKDSNKWLTSDGITSILNSLQQEEIMKSEVKTSTGHYLLLIYDDGENIKVITDSRLITDDMDKKFIRPITYGEMFFLAIYEVKDKYPGVSTRYPVTGFGSTFPTDVKVKPTIKTRDVKVLNTNTVIEKYPILTEKYFYAMSIHPIHVPPAGADFDGDMMSLIIFMSEDSIEELEELMDTKSVYVDPAGNIKYSVRNIVLDNLVKTINKGLEK